MVPAMLNKRRFTLKKILNRYMKLPFTQYQRPVTSDDVDEAGLGDAFSRAMKDMLPLWRKRKQAAEPVDIEVRGVAVALDEEISFSYYRYLSLQSPIYKIPLLPDLSRYEQYCHQTMLEGISVLPAVEKAVKKRALQDFMQDLLPVVHHVPIIRLSVYDRFYIGEDSSTLGAILAEDNERFYQPLADNISQQLQMIDDNFDPIF